VTPTGKMSNFLLDDYEAMINFIDAKIQKKKLKLRSS